MSIMNGMHIKKLLAKLKKIEEVYTELIFKPVSDVSMVYVEVKEQALTAPLAEWDWKEAKKGTLWGGPWQYAWFRGSVTITESLAGQPIYVHAKTNGWETLFFVDNEARGLFNNPIEAANRGNHHTLRLTDHAHEGESFELAFEAYAGHPDGGASPYHLGDSELPHPPGFIRKFDGVSLMTCRQDVMDFVFDLRTLNQLVEVLPQDSFRRAAIINCLIEIFTGVVQMPYERQEDEWRPKLAELISIMKPLLERKNSQSSPKAGIIGHSHMDTAWMWTIDETIHKCARTYSNVLSLMDQYPEYMFMQSSVFHLELMRRHYPQIYQGIKAKVKEGRWEPNGGSWIESDCNLVSGESLIRQFIKGQMYTQEHLAYRSDTFWLPDTFGYSGAIPQIMKGCGMKYFLTTKLSWNDTNTFPYDTFNWVGIDGTEVLTHFNDIHCWPDAATLINKIYGTGPKDFRTVKNFIQHKHVNHMRLISYGFGDGGGGPQYDMLEAARRCEDLEGCPKAYHTSVSRFMDDLMAESHHVPKYVGELYFEGHRGTLTQMHEIKRNNRKAEIQLRDLEFFNVLQWIGGKPSINHKIEALYETLLVNQFHDILPGTSIAKVHERAKNEMTQLIEEAKQMTRQLTRDFIEGGRCLTIWNTLSWPRCGQLVVDAIDDGLVAEDDQIPIQCFEDIEGHKKWAIGNLDIPQMSALSIKLKQGLNNHESPFTYKGNSLETPTFIVEFDEQGFIELLIDKSNDRQLRSGTFPLNTFFMGEDVPEVWDNWDIDVDLQYKLKAQTQLLSETIVSDGPLQFRIRRSYRIGPKSKIDQDMVFYSDRSSIDFETIIDWKDPHHFLKVGFEVGILSDLAKHEIQFGHVQRTTHQNTGYDQAMFEVCNHKWTDLSESRYGVAILNDCKYGISVNGSDMQLSLHKGGTHPDPSGDVGKHKCTYTLLTHHSPFSVESVIRPAYELNIPVEQVEGLLRQPMRSLCKLSEPNIIIETVKMAEDGLAFVIRMYEAERSATSVVLELGTEIAKVYETNMLEDHIKVLEVLGQSVRLEFRAFEIKTIKVYMKN